VHVLAPLELAGLTPNKVGNKHATQNRQKQNEFHVRFLRTEKTVNRTYHFRQQIPDRWSQHSGLLQNASV
jgi:hypothetical protein